MSLDKIKADVTAIKELSKTSSVLRFVLITNIAFMCVLATLILPTNTVAFCAGIVGALMNIYILVRT